MNLLNLYIVVVTYNAEKWISTFASPFQLLPENWKVIVVDNASKDRTIEILQRDYPHFYIIKNNKNFGFGYANNLGMKMALADDADFVFLLNQDACITVESLKTLMEGHQRHPECLVISPLQYNIDYRDLHTAFTHFCHPKITPVLLGDALGGKLKDLYYTKMVGAAAWLISNKCLKIVGGFNPAFFLYYEDNDYANRIIYHGYSIGIATSCKIEHHDGERKNIPDQKFLCELSEFTNPSTNRNSPRLFLAFAKAVFRSLRRGLFRRTMQLVSHMFFVCRQGFLSKKTSDKIKIPGSMFLE